MGLNSVCTLLLLTALNNPETGRAHHTRTPRPKRASLPVVLQECDLLPIRHHKAVFGGLVPVHIVDTVGAVIVAGDDNTANQELAALVLEVLLVLLVDSMPSGRGKRLCMASVHSGS